MENLQLEMWQSVLLGVAYIGYLCFVMFGGLRKRKIKISVYIIMTALMIYGVIHEFTGINSVAEVINICMILTVGLIKGIVLGKQKITEKSDGTWYIYHNKKYIILWVSFFAVKIILTQILKLATDSEIPMWHMILYFSFYYPWRTFNVFYNNPEMRKEVLSKHR